MCAFSGEKHDIASNRSTISCAFSVPTSWWFFCPTKANVRFCRVASALCTCTRSPDVQDDCWSSACAVFMEQRASTNAFASICRLAFYRTTSIRPWSTGPFADVVIRNAKRPCSPNAISFYWKSKFNGWIMMLRNVCPLVMYCIFLYILVLQKPQPVAYHIQYNVLLQRLLVQVAKWQ